MTGVYRYISFIGPPALLTVLSGFPAFQAESQSSSNSTKLIHKINHTPPHLTERRHHEKRETPLTNITFQPSALSTQKSSKCFIDETLPANLLIMRTVVLSVAKKTVVLMIITFQESYRLAWACNSTNIFQNH